MLPDDVLAANLWTWPDPLIKRDRAGAVVFINAAFLGLYGGRVQDWQGNVVNGWPEPSTQTSQRFETRAGVAPNQTVYDWVETPMSDGSVLAIARDVTMFVSSAPPAPHRSTPQDDMVMQAGSESPPAQQDQLMPDLAAQAPQASAPDHAVHEQAIQDSSAPAAPMDGPHAGTAAPTHETAHQQVHHQAHNQAQSAPTQTAPAHSSPAQASYAQSETLGSGHAAGPQGTPQEQIKQHGQAEAQAETESHAQAEPQAEEPMIERRALPIEDSASVLGANWRDQVIAKAVGETAVADTSPQSDTQGDMKASDQVEDDQPQEKRAQGLRILLAEDNAINALLTRTLLEAEGADVDTVEDGALALQAVKENSYDLIFMDMRMPNMDGLESTRKIRAYGATLPIIALTANAFDDDRNACFDSGMNDFMTKPVSAEELSAMVMEWTKKKQEAA